MRISHAKVCTRLRQAPQASGLLGELKMRRVWKIQNSCPGSDSASKRRVYQRYLEQPIFYTRLCGTR